MAAKAKCCRNIGECVSARKQLFCKFWWCVGLCDLQMCCFVRWLFIIWFVFLCLLVANCLFGFCPFTLGGNVLVFHQSFSQMVTKISINFFGLVS